MVEKLEVRYLTVDAQHQGRRIDNYLIGILGKIPKSRVYSMLRSGEVRVNGGRARPDRRLNDGDRLRIPPVYLAASAPNPENQEFPAPILYEDDSLMIVDKPAGLSVHAGTAVAYGLIERARAARPENQYLELVHRLDRETSGCLMLAKEPRRLRALHRLLRAGDIRKRYLTLVAGRWPGVTVVKRSLRRRGGGPQAKMTVSDDGMRAESHFASSKEFKRATFMEVELFSGRTHQIRVHAAVEGHPIAGDSRYGERDFNRDLRRRGLRRLFLHASTIVLPDDVGGEQILVSSKLPADLGNILEVLD